MTPQIEAAVKARAAAISLTDALKSAHDQSDPMASIILSSLLRVSSDLEASISRYENACLATVAQTET